MRTWWQLLQAWWSDDDTGSGIPAEGTPGTYVPTLNTTTRVVTWQPATGGSELLVDDASVELLFDDVGGDVLYDG
jgi:hypothetical protein